MQGGGGSLVSKRYPLGFQHCHRPRLSWSEVHYRKAFSLVINPCTWSAALILWGLAGVGQMLARTVLRVHSCDVSCSRDRFHM
jgi:hypothetical protein